MRYLWAGVMILCCFGAASPEAAAWQASEAVEVSGPLQSGIFPHLESAGRRNLAVDGHQVAIVWEDNRSGMPEIYLSTGDLKNGFSAPLKVSAGAAAYEPAVAARPKGGFMVAWEEQGALWAAQVDHGTPTKPALLAVTPARQVSLTTAPDRGVWAAWIEGRRPDGSVRVGRLQAGAGGPALDTPVAVEKQGVASRALYPALAATPDYLMVAWEDRRHGHTRLYYSSRVSGQSFSAPRELNERPPAASTRFGKGTGVTRVALAAQGPRVVATWMDKRDFQGGYDIYAALSDESGRFGANQLVQDMFGENTPQWHPAVAASAAGPIGIAWDDTRDGTPDIWITVRDRENTWSDDFAPTPAAGTGAQAHPAVAFDGQGRLHLAWVHRAEAGAQVRYALLTPASVAPQAP